MSVLQSSVAVDDHEFLATEVAEGGSKVLRRRRLAGFEGSGESGCVAHVWDASFTEYASTVRPSALLLFFPSSAGYLSAPAEGGSVQAQAADPACSVDSTGTKVPAGMHDDVEGGLPS